MSKIQLFKKNKDNLEEFIYTIAGWQSSVLLAP
jgi:hypothetical protein